jgi:two-component system alkaline phosphatase synthesis response regulator PhoP
MLKKYPHILIVDDNEEILSTISIILNRRAYQVSAKDRIENFEQTIEELSPDLILLDKNLGWADGCDLCKTIKSNKRLSSIPVIMFSAYYKKREECMNAGANDFIQKPFEMNDLITTIQSFAGYQKPV